MEFQGQKIPHFQEHKLFKYHKTTWRNKHELKAQISAHFFAQK